MHAQHHTSARSCRFAPSLTVVNSLCFSIKLITLLFLHFLIFTVTASCLTSFRLVLFLFSVRPRRCRGPCATMLADYRRARRTWRCAFWGYLPGSLSLRNAARAAPPGGWINKHRRPGHQNGGPPAAQGQGDNRASGDHIFYSFYFLGADFSNFLYGAALRCATLECERLQHCKALCKHCLRESQTNTHNEHDVANSIHPPNTLCNQ